MRSDLFKIKSNTKYPPQVLNSLDDEDDINVITDYFSYEHFYVVYCKFWELDTDHDLVIDKQDLLRHASGG